MIILKKSKVMYFKLKSILTFTTGHFCDDDYIYFWNFVHFVCDDAPIGPYSLEKVVDKVKNHLLTIHPELKNVKYKECQDTREFVSQQEEKFGGFLPVTRLGEKLPKAYRIRTSSYVPSNDSEVIADLIDCLEYDPSKTDEVLARYENIVKTDGPVKSLKPKNKK